MVNKSLEPVCSFCGKPQSQVEHLITGPNGVYICSECIELCSQMIDKEVNAVEPEKSVLPTPSEMMEKLNEYIIGQEDAKRVLCVAVYNHYKRIEYNRIHNKKKNDSDDKKKDDVHKMAESNKAFAHYRW